MKIARYFTFTLLAIIVVLGLAFSFKLDDPSLSPRALKPQAVSFANKPVAPFIEERQVLFGDLHIHTGFSTDAYVMGVRSEPNDVYRFAKGEVISHGAGYPIRISRPLDFAAVTDHAEYLGQARLANLDVPTTQQPLKDLLRNGSLLEVTLAWLKTSLQIQENGFSPGGTPPNRRVNLDAWQATIKAAEDHNRPGIFTSFIGYEWSGDAGSITAHMHRNVLFRSNQVPEIPFSSIDSNRPEDLWKFLEGQGEHGRVAMAIPHNPNFSGGNMYAPKDSEGNPFTEDYAAMRSRFEPISEILQIKGASETHPLLSSEDEFAGFEVLGDSLFISETTLETTKGGYARDALRVGMELNHREGFNPFDFGVIGSSDSHNASSPSDEGNYTGKLPMLDGSAGLRTDEAMLLPEGINPVVHWGSGGLAAVWAQENTRESIFDALQRKETYATSGPRLKLRFFAGWDYAPALLGSADVIEQAYAGGVPMGGVLTAVSGDQKPSFIIMAAKDPLGANLDRVQIVKAWVDLEGKSHEQVIDVASADGRTVDSITNKLPPVGNTVDVATASYLNSIGSTLIHVHWTDPQFDPALQALYYARLLEIPTPRWSTYDAVKLGTTPMEPTSIQERAISSAIWYQPPPS
jgi:hypothetical protein